MNSPALHGALAKRRIFILSAVAALSFVVFVLSNLASFNHNDFMYAVAPAVWAQNGALYTDVPFVQAPLSIMLNALLVAVTGDVNVFLPARVVSMVLVLVAVLLPVLNRAKFSDPQVWLLYVALALTNFFVTSNSREIGNYALSLLCLSAAVTIVNAPGAALWRGFAASAFAGLAISAKLYFIVMAPALFLYFLINDRSARDPRVVAACGFGFLLGLAPILFFLIRDPHGFLLWNIEIHQKILPLRIADASAGILKIANSLTIFVVLMAVPLGFFMAAAHKAWRAGDCEWRAIFARLLLLAAAAVMAISPVFVFEQYFGPLALLLLLFSAPWHSTGEKQRSLFLVFAGAMVCMQCIILAQLFGPDTMRNGGLAVAQVRDVQNNARRIVENDYICARKLYTAAPLFLLENGVKYPPEMAAGPFLMFLRDEALAQKGDQFDLDVHIKKWNPDILIWGYHLGSHDPAEDEVDRFIRDYAISHGFLATSLGQVGGHAIELGYRPGCKKS
jgi:hypothetical protein